MTSDMTISLALIFAIVSAVGTIVGIISAVKKQQENDNNKALEIEKNFVKVNFKLDEFCEQSRALMKNLEKTDASMQKVSEELVRQGERIENLYHKTKDHEERIKKLEDER